MEKVNFKLEALSLEDLKQQQKDINMAACKGDTKTILQLLKDGADVNTIDNDGGTPLIHAVSNGHIDLVIILLTKGANVYLVDNDGYNPLHTATSKCHTDIVEVLLKHVSRYELNEFVNAKITSSGSTSLHLAAKGGYLQVIKLLLKNGATYNVGNSEGKLPIDLCKEPTVMNFLNLIETLFRDITNGNPDSLLKHFSGDELNEFINAKIASSGYTLLHLAAKGGYLPVIKLLLKNGATYNVKNSEGKRPIDLCTEPTVMNFLNLIEKMFRDITNGNPDSLSKLGTVDPDEFLAITNARNKQMKKLLQVAIINKHMNITSKLLKMLVEPSKDQSQLDPKCCEMERLEKVKWTAEKHIEFSKIYLKLLRSMSHKDASEVNPSPRQAVKEGLYYLSHAHSLVKAYQECVPGSINNKDIKRINNMLLTLEFDPEHYEAYHGQTECFVSRVKGARYYELLHSELKKDVRLFIEMAELSIYSPALRFLETIRVTDNPEYDSDRLKKIIGTAERHMEYSKLYLPMLRGMSQRDGHSEVNFNPWKTVKEGSYYLGNASHLVGVYQQLVPGSINNENIKSLNYILVALEFDQGHISSGFSDEAYGGQVPCFLSKGQGSLYYELLHSRLKEDVRFFIEMVELCIDSNVLQFLKSSSKIKGCT